MNFCKLAPLVAAAIVLGIMIVSGCKNGESMLIGKWKNISLEEIVVFKKDKTGTFEVKNNPSLILNGPWWETTKLK